MLSGLIFSMAIIFTTPDVAVTLQEINMVDKNAEVYSFSLAGMLTSQQRETVIICFMGCGRHGS